MKRFAKMVGMLTLETLAFVVAIYLMVAITGWMYYEDIIRWRETLDTITNVFGVGFVITYLSAASTTIYLTIKHNVYEDGLKEI